MPLSFVSLQESWSGLRIGSCRGGFRSGFALFHGANAPDRSKSCALGSSRAASADGSLWDSSAWLTHRHTISDAVGIKVKSIDCPTKASLTSVTRLLNVLMRPTLYRSPTWRKRVLGRAKIFPELGTNSHEHEPN